jgi:hypothetical protein
MNTSQEIAAWNITTDNDLPDALIQLQALVNKSKPEDHYTILNRVRAFEANNKHRPRILGAVKKLLRKIKPPIK